MSDRFLTRAHSYLLKELGKFPLRGQVAIEFNDLSIRQLVLKPYRIIYRVE